MVIGWGGDGDYVEAPSLSTSWMGMAFGLTPKL
jgi:hypothetical protein